MNRGVAGKNRWLAPLGPAMFIVFLLALWQFGARKDPGHLLPGPWGVAGGILDLLHHGLLLKYVVASLFRVTWGFLLAVVTAIPLGLAIGSYRRAQLALNPVIQILRPISPLAWIPIAILWFGVGDMSAIFLIFLSCFLPLLLTAIQSVRNIPEIYVRAGHNFGLSSTQRMMRVLLPAIVPQLIVGLRITLGIAWLVVVAAEMIAVNSGLGFLIVDARNAGNRYDLVLAGMVMIGIIGLLLDTGIRSLEKGEILPLELFRGVLALIENPAKQASAAKLSVEHVSITFERDGKTTPVLEDIGLEVADGEFVCLLGPSGCGKSTLLNAMAGFLAPSGGEIKVDGEVVRGPDSRRIFVFQERGVFPWLTVEQNIGFGLHKLPRAEQERRIAHYVSMIGLQGFEKSYPSDLSGGMKQRLEVARALAVNPDMLFLDEPFGALDSITRMVMRSELLRIWEAERKTIIFVTHDIDEAVQLADRVVVMSSRPARIQQIVSIDIDHPRDISSARYLELRDGILKQLGLAHKI